MQALKGNPSDGQRRVLEAFSSAHDSLFIDEKKELDIRIKEDSDNYFTIEDRRNAFSIEVSDVFLEAPDNVLESLATVIVSKCYMVPYFPELWHDVKDYLAEDHIIEKSQRTFLRTSKQVRSDPKGDEHDLDVVFDNVKKGYFKGANGPDLGFKEPVIAWSRRRSHKRFGYWMEDYNIIVINRILDNPKVPLFVVEYVLYHELLHKKHGSINISGARESHYHHFNIDERRFEKWKDAEAFLEKIYKTRGSCLK